jgi:hypothetical protein
MTVTDPIIGISILASSRNNIRFDRIAFKVILKISLISYQEDKARI